MKTIFHDNESGTKLEMEGTFANSKAQLLDNEENVLAELEGSYSEILEMINQFSEGEDRPEKEEPKQYEEPLTNSDFHGAKVKVLEDIEDEYGDVIDKGTVTTDIRLVGADLFIEGVFVRPKDFKKLEILTDEQEDIQVGDYVRVKEGKEHDGAKGFAIVTGIEDGDVYLKGINIHGDYSETWVNNVSNVIKIG